MSKVAILLANMYEDMEFWYPYYRLKEDGNEVVIVADKGGETYTSKHGYPARSDVSAADVSASDFDAIIIPGGFAPDFMRRSESMLEFVRQAVKANRLIAAICHGVWMLCHTDILRGRRCTSFPSIRYDVQNAGGKWVDLECCVDGNLITSRRPDDLPAFCQTICQALSKALEPAGVDAD
jgi:protease I